MLVDGLGADHQHLVPPVHGDVHQLAMRGEDVTWPEYLEKLKVLPSVDEPQEVDPQRRVQHRC